MNRRSIIVCTVVAALLLVGIGCLFCFLFFGDSGKPVKTDRLTDGVEAVPSDAILLFEAGTLSEIIEMTDEGSALGRLIGCIPSVSSDWKAALSMHYSSKNTVSPLLVLSIPDDMDPALLLDDVLGECGGVIEKRYGHETVHKSAVPDASFAVCGHFLIASPSMVMVESSLRHLDNGASIMDEPLYEDVSGVTSGRGVLHVNFANLGKLFSGAAGKEYVRYASFFQSVADWGAFGLSDSQFPSVFNGRLRSTGSGKKYSDVLCTQRGGKPEVFSVVPHNASYVLTLPLSSYEDYMSAYRMWLAASGRKKDYDYINVRTAKDSPEGISTEEFVRALDLSELAVFSYMAGDSERKILALRTDNPEALHNYSDTVCEWLFKGYVPSLMGEMFRPSSEESYCMLGDWVLVGDSRELLLLRRAWKSGTFFSLHDYMEQTPAEDELREVSTVSLVVDVGKYADSLVMFLKEPYRSCLRKSLGNNNFEYMFVNAGRLGEDLGVRVSVYAGDLAVLPRPENTLAASEDVPVVVPSGPFPVKNFIDGSTNYLEQLDNHSLRLLNSARRPVWTVNFDTPLCGTVRQIDYLKNNKLQMLFASGDKVWLLDRLGRVVRDFPVKLDREILLGPDVYDFSGNKDYTLMILHTDNTLVQYGTDGRRIGGWNDIKPGERIVALPEMLQVGGNVYWVVRTSYQTLIYDSHGMVCADFSKKRKLKKDTAVEPLSSNTVAVTTADGKKMVLDLSDGSFRKR